MKDLLKQNVGTLERVLRVLVGIVLLALGVSADGGIGMVLMVVSIPLLLTGITGNCPTYSLLGISTKRIETCC